MFVCTALIVNDTHIEYYYYIIDYGKLSKINVITIIFLILLLFRINFCEALNCKIAFCGWGGGGMGILL